jgi:hypothetical protein
MESVAKETVRLYQEGNDSPEQYRGEDDPRNHIARPKLTPQLQLLVNVLGERQKNHCNDNCAVPEKLRPHMGTITDSIEDIGDGNMKRGIVRSRDTIKRTVSTFDTIDKSKGTFSTTVIRSLGTLFLFIVGYGIIELIKLKLKG